MHDKQKKDVSLRSRDMDEVKKQLNNLTKMFTEFQNDNNKIKEEIKNIKGEFVKNKAKKVIFFDKPSPINNNNKRTKADTSSSENEENDLILNIESKVEKQDKMLNNMFNMIKQITGQIDSLDNQNANETSNIGGVRSYSNNNNQNQF